jgi:hypothetical protein
MSQDKWIESSKELPPCDGFYQCTNHPDRPFDLGTAKYDGFGFDCFGIYKNPKYWRYIHDKEKRYGVIDESS